jgi:16S rRNA processing protein RimM
MMPAKRILMGEIGRPHGVRGLVKLRSFTADPAAIASYGPLTDEAGTRRFALTLLAEGLARIEGVADRDAAQKLTGMKLYIERDRLPPPEEEDEFYLADLIGLAARDRSGNAFGTVRAVEEHGAGAFLALETPRGEVLLPFTKACVPVVDLAGGFVTVVPPDEVLVREEDAA